MFAQQGKALPILVIVDLAASEPLCQEILGACWPRRSRAGAGADLNRRHNAPLAQRL